MQFPTVIGGVDIIVNMPGVRSNQLKLTGAMLADIYMGKITKWNDPKIAELNPGLKLPGHARSRRCIALTVRARRSSSPTISAMQSPEWKSKVGASTSVNWPAGAGAKGSDGVAGTVRQINGGIGYVESAYAEQNHLTTTLLRTRPASSSRPT